MSFLYLGICFFSLLYLWFSKTKKSKTDPPGPTPWPIFGNLVQFGLLSRNVPILRTLDEMKKTYGEIFSIQLGMRKTVALTSYEAVQTVFNNDAVEKDRTGFFDDRSLGQNLGIITSNGDVWQNTRSWTFKHLKDFGFRTSAAEHDMQDAATEFMQFIDKQISEGNGKANLYMNLFFSARIFKLTWRMITGRLTVEDEKHIQLLCNKAEDLVRSGTIGMGILQAFPFLRFIIPKLTGYDVQMSFINTCSDTAKTLLLETRAKIEKEGIQGPPESLLEAFAQNMNKENGIFFMDNFKLIFQDIFIASTETLSSFMESCIVHLMLYPEMQEKIWKEIEAVAPDEDFLNFDHKKKMVFTQAFLLEVHRVSSIVPALIPRKTLRDIAYKNCVITKDTILIADIFSVHNDPEVFGDPENFRPERFINEKGELEGANRVLAFGVGKRVCAGEVNAHLMSFMFVTSLVKRYSMSIPEGYPKPSREMQPGYTCRPHPYEACFVKRR